MEGGGDIMLGPARKNKELAVMTPRMKRNIIVYEFW
tara:strand:- start:247 stop:354 length:108 start_codon:yes stop_codon:yes gene_type:complete